MKKGQIFLEGNDVLLTLSQAEYRTLFACVRLCYYYDDGLLRTPGSIVLSNANFCEEMARMTELNQRTIKNTLSLLCKKNILLRDSKARGVYYLNPLIAYKGDKTLYQELVEEQQIFYPSMAIL